MKPLFFALAAAASTWGAPQVLGAMHPAQSSDDFVDRIGVATHWGYTDTPYGYAYDRVSQLLGQSGIRHVRDGLHPRELDLYNRFGILSTVIVGPPRDPRETVKELEAVAGTLAAIEGPNEVDIFPRNSEYGGKVFPEGAKMFQDELYAAVKASPILKDVPVIAPSTARNGSNLKLAPLRSFDLLVMHSYAGGALPSRSLSNETIDNLRDAPRILGRGVEIKPITVTESGYHTALGANLTLGGVQAGISEEAHRKYLPRHFAEYFRAGIARTISYEFINEFKDEATNAEASFGMVRRDLTPKPAYFAIKNLISLLRESTWDAAEKKRITPPVTPRALDFDLEGAPPDVRHVLLQKSDGTFTILLWREVSSFDTKAQKEIPVAPASIRVRLRAKISGAQLFNLKQAAPLQSWNRTQSLQIQIQVPDEIVALRIAPLLPLARAVATPGEPSVEASGESLSLAWQPVANATGYFVWHHSKYLGATREPKFQLSRLAPGLGYRLRVHAFDNAGNISPAREFVASTKDVAPDLVVTSVSFEPTAKAGQSVRFKATIENRGDAPSPGDTTHGVAFSVDGQFSAWSDTLRGPIAPGAKVEVTSNNGPKGTAEWLAVVGAHKILARVDDVNRINESNEENNELEADVTVE